jgi:hypothetical protein
MPARNSRGRAGRAARVKRVKPRRRDARRRPSLRQTGTSPHPRRVTSSPCSGDPVHYALEGITAGWLLDRFAGIWELRQKPANTQATAFWRRIIGRRGPFEDLVADGERWHGPVQRFDSRTSATLK